MSHNPPKTKKIPQSLVTHKHERIDNYYWLKDRENPEVISYLEAENAYTKEVLKGTEADQKILFDEMKSRIKEDDSSVPYFTRGYWYYSRYETGKEYAIICRKKMSLDAAEEIMIDENLEAEKHPYYEIVSYAISSDNTTLAFAEDISGRRQYQIRFRNLNTGEFLPNLIKGAGSDLAWHNEGDHLFYCEKEKETLRPHKIYKYQISNENTSLIFEEIDEKYACGVSLSKDSKYIIIGSHSSLTTEFRLANAATQSEFKVVLPREEGHEYYPELDGDKLFIKSNKNAENFKLVSCNISDCAEENWETIQEHSLDVYIEDFEVFSNYVVIQEKENGLSRIKCVERTSGNIRTVPPREETYTLYIGTNPELEQDHLRIGYSSMTTPNSVIDIDFTTFAETIKKQQVVLGDFDSDNYASERIWANARDGVKVPVSLVYKKDLFKKNGQNPILIYAYGSYGSTIDPYFSSVRLSLLNRGFVFAIAHIRGGEYLGRQWYDNGKLLKKQNTFNDFIDCTLHLVEQGYAAKEKVYAMGGSAGGLLMGVIANDRPDLWKGIVSQVPFVDVVTTMLDDSIPLTTGEYDEWGNPDNKTYYDYMLSYSPYDQITSQHYPAMLVTSGLHDSQVQYWEPTKYIAKIREFSTGNTPKLLHTNMDAGHGGASGRFEALKEIALEYAFIFWLNGTKIK